MMYGMKEVCVDFGAKARVKVMPLPLHQHGQSSNMGGRDFFLRFLSDPSTCVLAVPAKTSLESSTKKCNPQLIHYS